MSIRNLPTLKGVFPEPRVQPKRDFLRENKLKLKELQKHIVNRKQLENEISEKALHKFSRNNSRQQLNPLKESNNKSLKKRSTSVNTLVSAQRLNSACTSSCCSGPHMCHSLHNRCCNEVSRRDMCRSQPIQSFCNATKPMPIITDRGTQTDDITDEDYLNDALKRCSSRDLHHSDVLDNNMNLNLSPHQLTNENCNQNHDLMTGGGYQQSRCNQSCHEIQSVRHQLTETEQPLHLDFQNLKIDHQQQQSMNNDCINHFPKRKTTKLLGAPDFKNRADIRLPKYLEKEKRERELNKLREMEKDPNCPEGHHILDDKDRQDALKLAQKKFEDLISELNHMPMTSETLRTRTRKNEIEKALVELEHDIRNFSKQKCYVRGGVGGPGGDD